MNQHYHLLWRTSNRHFTIEGLFTSLDAARGFLRDRIAADGIEVRGNWIVAFGEHERWTLHTTNGVYRIDPVPLDAAMPVLADEGE